MRAIARDHCRYSESGLEVNCQFFEFISPGDRKKMKKKLVAGDSSARSIELRRDFFSVTNPPPPDDLHLLCKYNCIFRSWAHGGAQCGPCVHATNSAPARNTTVQAHTRPTRHARHKHRSRRSTDDLPATCSRMPWMEDWMAANAREVDDDGAVPPPATQRTLPYTHASRASTGSPCSVPARLAYPAHDHV